MTVNVIVRATTTTATMHTMTYTRIGHCVRRTDRPDIVTDVCARHVDCGHCGRGRSDNNIHGHDVCHNKTGCQLSQFANTCAARADETARSHATVKRRNGAVCRNEIGRKTVKFADTCAARATKTARPLATVISNNNNAVCPNTVYCRGIFTDDDEDDEIAVSYTHLTLPTKRIV